MNRQFPHLLTADQPVWMRFLAQFGKDFTQFDYDIRVGEGRPAPEGTPAGIQKMSLDISKRRIDAIGFQPDKITVIEITRRAGLKALGQLIAYPILYQNSFSVKLPIMPLLVAEELLSDVEVALEANNIPFILLPEEI
ncbi:hypothetical protein KAR91_71920 [Candidatus Pacearchaeota archaeon]|nr:hypothetical protein [Candidatus Pacearchaeota archaeon]